MRSAWGITETKIYDAKGVLQSTSEDFGTGEKKWEYQYQKNGNLKSCQFTRTDRRPGWKGADYETETYNEQGLRIKKTDSYQYKEQELKISYEQEWVHYYNEKGHLVRVHWCTKKPDQARVIKERYKYSYE